MNQKKEGFIKVPGGNVWYKIAGKKLKPPLVALHGGPGYPHFYLQSLDALSDQRQVIFYDQLGCGKSDRPTDKKLWTVNRFVEELAEVIKTLNLDTYYLFGHSWGSALAASFALQKPPGLRGLILADPYLSTPIWIKDAKRLIKQLPLDTQKSINAYIKDGKETEEYTSAKEIYYFRYVTRFKKAPPEILKTRASKSIDVYKYMWGPEEFLPTGTLKDFDLTPKLAEITLPVLLLSGRFDEATPEALNYFQKLIPNAQLAIFEKSAHHPLITEKGKFIKTLNAFLQSTDIK